MPSAITNRSAQGLDELNDRHHFALAERLVKAGAKVLVNRYGMSPLVPACTNGNLPLINLLLEAGGDPNLAEPDGRTPLMVAAKTGKIEAVRTLLGHRATPNARERAQQQTALMWAAAEGHIGVVQLLIREGAHLEAKSKGGFTALHFAARQGNIEVVRALIEMGANVNEPTGPESSGASALAIAVTNLHYELGSVLLEAGADPNYTWQGRTVLHILTWVSRLGTGTNDPAPKGSGNLGRLDLLRELVKHGADVNRRMTSKRGGISNT